MKITVGAVRFWSWLRGADESDGRQGSFSDDLPIGSLREDLLGRGEFARALATVLHRYRGKESLVVALRGEWGSGKTSIKNLIVEMLTEPGRSPMKVVTFNPWQWGAPTKPLPGKNSSRAGAGRRK